MSVERQLSAGELEVGLPAIRQSPKENGELRMIVRRPRIGAREAVEEGELDIVEGLVGDNWLARGCRLTSDGTAHRDMQITIMNARAIALLARHKDRWPLAGDQLYVDLDLSTSNLPPGTRLAIGPAVVEVTAEAHTGCKQFAARFGTQVVKFVNSTAGKALRLRGLNAKIVRPGTIRVGDAVTKLAPADSPR